MKHIRRGLVVAFVAALAFFGLAVPAQAAPTITSFSPGAAANTGDTILTVTGTNFRPGANVQLVKFDQLGITEVRVVDLVNEKVQGTTRIVGTLQAGQSPDSDYVVRVIGAGDQTGSVDSTATFDLFGGAPFIGKVNPPTVKQNTSVILDVAGDNFARGATFTFEQGTTPPPLGNDITITNTQFVSLTQYKVTINVNTDADLGARDLTIENTDTQTNTRSPAIVVTTKAASPPTPPTVLSIDPDSQSNLDGNGAVAVTITGDNFIAGATAHLILDGHIIEVDNPVVFNTVVPNEDTISGTVDLVLEAPGNYDILAINTNGGNDTLPAGFVLGASGAPTVEDFDEVASPSGGNPAATNDIDLEVRETKTFTVNGNHFAKEDVASVPGGQVVVKQTRTVSRTELEVVLHVPPGSTGGSFNLRIEHTDGQFGGCSQCVNVTGADLRWFLTNNASSPSVNIQFVLGGPGDKILSCDWDGNGTSTPGIVRNGRWFLYKTNNPANGLLAQFSYGKPTDDPLCGDWDNHGTQTPGIRRGDSFFLRNLNSGGDAHVTLAYGDPGDTPIVGDFNGDGRDSFGVRRGAQFFLRNNVSSGNAQIVYAFGKASDTPTVGDWDGNGTDTPGVRRGSTFLLRNSSSSGPAHIDYNFGFPSDIPIVGDFNGDGVTTVGVVRSG